MSDEILIQRLVDNDLNDQQRVELIDRIGWRENNWKTIATAFLDKQILDQSLRNLVQDFEAQSPESSVSEVFSVGLDSAKKLSSVQQTGMPMSTFRMVLVASAAALVIAFFGFVAGKNMRHQDFDRAASVTTGPQDIGESKVTTADLTARKSTEFQLTEALARCGTPIPREFQLELLRAGYVLNENHEVKPVKLPFGGEIDIPVREFEIKFVGNSAYQ